MVNFKALSSISLLLVVGSAFGTSESYEVETRELRRLEKTWFDKKDDTFWVLKNRDAFIQASHQLIDENGNWLGSQPAPAYVKYTSGEFKEEDLKLLEKWLSLDTLECFSLAEQYKSGPLDIILEWTTSLQEQGVDLKKKGIYKIACLSGKTTTNQLEYQEYGDADIAAEWIETNRLFQMKNSHYRDYGIQAH